MRTLGPPALAVLLAVSPVAGQAPADTLRADSVRAAVTAEPAAVARPVRVTRDTLSGPPISPRSAFLRSLIVPGLGQAALDRGTAGAFFVSLEALSLLMTVKSKRDLSVARRQEGERPFVRIDPAGDTVFAPSPVAGRVRARKQHVEDWVALLIFNHLFAGADAFVAAQLWDVPARVSVTRDGDRTRLAATVRW